MNEVLQLKIVSLEDECAKVKKEHVEELLRQQQHTSDKDKRNQSALRDAQEQLQILNNEIQAKSVSLRRLEEENSKLRIDAGQYESRLDSCNNEIDELHSCRCMSQPPPHPSRHRKNGTLG